MGLLSELAAGLKAYVVMKLSDWVVVVVAAVVFLATFLAGRAVVGTEAGLGIGIIAALLAASVLGARLRNRLIEQ